MSITTKERSEVTTEPQNLLSAILSMVRDPSVDVDKLQAILAMQERLEGRQAVAAFNQAFAEMEPELPRVKKNGTVEYKGSKAFQFARWEDIDDIIRPIMRRHGFSLSFDTKPRQGDGGGLIVTGTLMHRDGHSHEASIPLALDASGGKNNIQGAGSTFSYGKRYTATMLLNLTTEGADDDGVAAGVSFINPDEIAKLEALMKETRADRVAFLRFLGVDALADVERKNFAGAVNALMAKRRKIEAEQEIV